MFIPMMNGSNWNTIWMRKNYLFPSAFSLMKMAPGISESWMAAFSAGMSPISWRPSISIPTTMMISTMAACGSHWRWRMSIWRLFRHIQVYSIRFLIRMAGPVSMLKARSCMMLQMANRLQPAPYALPAQSLNRPMAGPACKLARLRPVCRVGITPRILSSEKRRNTLFVLSRHITGMFSKTWTVFFPMLISKQMKAAPGCG